MPEIRLELSTEELRKLDTEVDLLGFANRAAYLQWIIGNRAAIEQGTERDQLLTEYQSRVDELESQLASRETPSGEADGDRARATDGSGTATADGSSGESGTVDACAADAARAADAESRASSGRSAGNSDEPEGGESERSSSTTANERPADGESRAVDTQDGIGGNFRPERVERFEDESLGSQANQLRGVEGERLDEFARRAVAKTRERLGREPSTGLDYRSQTRISRSSSDVRPGEDLVDLDELDVPGRSAETQAPRREAVGAALAYLRDVGRAKRADFVAELYEEYPAGYDTDSGWWRCVKRGLKDARVVDGGEGARVWTYDPPGSTEGELVGSGPKRVVDPD